MRRSYEAHIRCYLTPLLGEIPLARLRPDHIAGMFQTIRGWNAEITWQRAAGRAWIVAGGDVRKSPRVIGENTQRRVYATQRPALNAAVKQRLIAWNPCAGVELPPEDRPEARRWTARRRPGRSSPTPLRTR